MTKRRRSIRHPRVRPDDFFPNCCLLLIGVILIATGIILHNTTNWDDAVLISGVGIIVLIGGLML